MTGFPDPIQVRTITVKTGRLVCDIAIPDERLRFTNPRIAAFVSQTYPDLPDHACVNDCGPVFGAVIERTSMPHLLEHLAISEQARRAREGAASFVGTSEWVDEFAGLARIQMSFRDDLEALRAFSDATRFLNMAVLTCLA